MRSDRAIRTDSPHSIFVSPSTPKRIQTNFALPPTKPSQTIEKHPPTFQSTHSVFRFCIAIPPAAPHWTVIPNSSHQLLPNEEPSWMEFKKAKQDYLPNH